MSVLLYYCSATLLLLLQHNMATKCIQLNPPQNFLDTPGEPPVVWCRWKQTFDMYFTAAGYSGLDTKRQVAITIHALGMEGQRILFVTHKDIADIDNVADLNQKLKELFGKVNISGERSKFRARKQRVGESITSYMASLRE